jgi:adenosylcobinamide-GDP ribazoletransferase
MAVTALTGRYARTQGLASSFLSEPARGEGPPWVAPVAIGTILVVGLAAVDDAGTVIAMLAAAVAAAGVADLARRRIGGFTGDTLGAGGVVAETVGLLAAVAVLRP